MARELGTNISRAKISKPEKSKRKTRANDISKSNLVQEKSELVSSTSFREQEDCQNDSTIKELEIQNNPSDDVRSGTAKWKDILEPNEEVYSGSKVYSSLFCFWQVQFTIF